MNAVPSEIKTDSRPLIRAFEPADAARICALFQQHSSYKRDAAFWLWLNRLLPVSPSLIAVAEIDGNLAAHYAILPMDLRLPGGSIVRCGHGVHAFVSPEYRQQVSIFQISAFAYQLARDAGLDFVYGFPNANYRLVQEKIERWTRVSLFKAWTKSSSSQTPAAHVRLIPAHLESDPELHAAVALWEKNSRQGDIAQPADLTRWWQLRYLSHPQKPYEFHWLEIRSERAGLVVTKTFAGEGETRAHIIDYVLAGEHTEALLAAFENAYAARVSRFVHWPVDSAFAAALAGSGYLPDGFETWFGLRNLNSAQPHQTLKNPAAWRLPMGFSDAF